MATLDELTQRPDLTHFSMHITKTLVSSVAATAAAAAVVATLVEVCDVYVPLPQSLARARATPLRVPLPVSLCADL